MGDRPLLRTDEDSPTKNDKYYDFQNGFPERPERRGSSSKTRISKIVSLDQFDDNPYRKLTNDAPNNYQKPTSPPIMQRKSPEEPTNIFLNPEPALANDNQPEIVLHPTNNPQQLKDLAFNANLDAEDQIHYPREPKPYIEKGSPNKGINERLTSAYPLDSQAPNNQTTGSADTKDGDFSNSSLILKYDGSNIDTTGEKARLVSVRKLDDSEGPSVHTLEGNSESSSSSLPEPNDGSDIFLPKRYVLAIMMFMGFVNMYAIRVNLNVAIGAMVNNHTIVQDGVAILVVSSNREEGRG